MTPYPRMLLMAVCLAVNGVLHAQSVQGGDRTGAPNPGQESNTPGAPDRERPRQAPRPAATFNPSEKIGADSAVSFPVDI